MSRPVKFGAAIFALALLSACNTVQGAGEDIENAGEGIQNAAEDV